VQGATAEEINYKNISIHFWDVSIEEYWRQIWRTTYTNPAGIIFVVDSTD